MAGAAVALAADRPSIARAETVAKIVRRAAVLLRAKIDPVLTTHFLSVG
jgi:hypothetical protein